MPASIGTWIDRFWQDLQPTPGRLSSSLRIVLATVLTLVLLMVLRMPSASLGLYYIFLIGRDSPAISLRSGVFSLLALAFTVATVLGVVGLTDNNPMARLLSVSIVVFLAGMLMLSTTITVLASTWGFIYCTLIALWETHAPADYLVKQTLYVIGTVSIAVLCSVAVEYFLGAKDPAAELQKQRRIRYEALAKMFSLYACLGRSMSSGLPQRGRTGCCICTTRLWTASSIRGCFRLEPGCGSPCWRN
jgi:multidrug resistance protein MdtO